MYVLHACRSAAPASLGSTASALYLCIRNLVGGLGPISIALLAERVGLQNAMLLIPAVYLASGVLFVFAERWYAVDMAEKAAGQLKQAAASALEAAKTVLPPARGLDAGKGAPGSGAAAAA